MNGMAEWLRTRLDALLSWLLPGRGGHRGSSGTGVLCGTAVATATVASTAPRAPRRLVHVRRVPPGLLLLCGEDSRLVRPYVRAPKACQSPPAHDVRRRELAERVRMLNAWSSGGCGRR
ncbi:hypothetical protein HEK616_02120 [Streptomyces nigrescens]|uniref:Secreted protein n=1 Tax=Streptomyces nigrescens TaxID=1920 RepID=A0ABM7ZKD3_STRNI|nr:hypothetical protein HEK616_02120 [Streptomyces nigrescens]